MAELGEVAVSDLIEAVRVHPCLYDKKHEKYNHTKAKERIWAQIAAETNIKDGDSARARWRNLKDCYLKYKRANSGGSGSNIRWLRTYRSWRWAAQLAFLEPYIGTMLDGRFRPMRRRPIRMKKPKEIPEPEEQIEDHAPPDLDPLHFLGQPPTFSGEVQNMVQPCEEADSTYHLFMSYVETFRKFSARRQAMLKVDLAQLFAAAEMEQIQEEQGRTQNLVLKIEGDRT